jgi:3-phenylpropionate/trans-cinnamate dioxygenase ferredoxin subunit
LGRFIKTVMLEKLESGTIHPFDINGNHIILVRLEDSVYALSGYCTHEETDLANGFLVEDRVICPLHLSQFDCRTGAVLNPPATEPLKLFNVKIEDGWVLVEV